MKPMEFAGKHSTKVLSPRAGWMRAPLQQADLDAAVALLERMDAVFTIDGMAEPTARIMQFLGWTRTSDKALRMHRNGYGAKAEERGMGGGQRLRAARRRQQMGRHALRQGVRARGGRRVEGAVDRRRGRVLRAQRPVPARAAAACRGGGAWPAPFFF